MALTLYSAPVSLYCGKVEVALREKGIDAEIVRVPYSKQGGFDKPPAVLRINPKAQIPVLIDDDLELFDSTLICEYLEEIEPQPALWPAGPRERAAARLWELKADEVLGDHIRVLLAAARGSVERSHVVAAKQAILSFYDAVDGKLWEQPYLARQFSYADIALYMAVLFASVCRVPPPAEYECLHRWMRRIGERPSVRSVVTQTYAGLREIGVEPPV